MCASKWYLFARGTVAFDKVVAHFSFVGHVDVTVGAVVVVADPLQEVGAHRHLRRDTDRQTEAHSKPSDQSDNSCVSMTVF